MVNLRRLPDLQVDLVVKEAERDEGQRADDRDLAVAAEHDVRGGLVQLGRPVGQLVILRRVVVAAADAVAVARLEYVFKLEELKVQYR